MKPKDIRAGLAVTVGWFHTIMTNRYDRLASGVVIMRRGHEIKFHWESGDYMGSDFHGWPKNSADCFRVNIADIKSINGLPIKDWAKLSP